MPDLPFTQTPNPQADRGQKVEGNREHGQPDSGKPVKLAGKAINTLPTDVANNDRTDIYATLAGALHISPSIPGASEVLSERAAVTSVTVATMITPTSGKRIRIVAISFAHVSTVAAATGIYFGTGANIASDSTKAIAEFFGDIDVSTTSVTMVFPDGGGPVGAIDDVVSVRNSVASSDSRLVIHYREE